MSATRDADTARELASIARYASLATLTEDGHPFGSLVAVAADARGRPVLLLSSLAEHTKNLARDDKASLLYFTSAPASASADDSAADDPLARPRVTLLGSCRTVPADEVDDARARYLAAHPEAAQWASFKDFAFYRLEVADVRVVAGFGRMSWVAAEDYFRARSPS
jgi:putative heme iron utilization protein